MRIASSTIRGASLYIRGSGRRAQLGYVYRMFVDPGLGRLTNLSVRPHRFWGVPKLYNSKELEVHKGHLTLADDMSVDTVDNEAVSLEGSLVYTKSGLYLGRVEQVYYESAGFMLTQLEVAKRFLVFSYMHLLIARQDILDMKPRQIIVRDSVVEEADVATVLPQPGSFVPNSPQAQQSQMSCD